MRVFCWPYAGLGASLFVPWSRSAPESVGVYGIQAPGRESRISEPAITYLPEMIERLVGAMAEEPGLFDAPYALVGCSFGAIASLELARALPRAGLPAPVAMTVFACRAPHRVQPVGPFSTLDDEALIDRLHHDYGGVPEALRQQPELLRLFLPALRGDLAAMERYAPPADGLPLACPIFARGGDEDTQVPGDVLAEWTRWGGAGSDVRQGPGGHFLVRDKSPAALAETLRVLRPWLPS
ncbi:thioesterase II family protein [Salinarimonas ramus]|uniref:Thioesterase n=1 Tax=Salinarimonas ramus TaxID=690164 RepID=A0A917QG68_9HYPH|nr:thioesterase [Salinarimonas ramus]GGK48823.1 thioesterase [Salinarimonas ramus]